MKKELWNILYIIKSTFIQKHRKSKEKKSYLLLLKSQNWFLAATYLQTWQRL